MKSSDRAAGTKRLVALARNHQGRTVVAFDDPGRGNTDHAAVPAFAVHDDAVGITKPWICAESIFDRAQDSPFFLLAVAVELVELGSEVPRACRILDAEQLDHIARNIHPPRGVDAGSDAEANFARCGRTLG